MFTANVIVGIYLLANAVCVATLGVVSVITDRKD
jgi:hypothetical protein